MKTVKIQVGRHGTFETLFTFRLWSGEKERIGIKCEVSQLNMGFEGSDMPFKRCGRERLNAVVTTLTMGKRVKARFVDYEGKAIGKGDVPRCQG